MANAVKAAEAALLPDEGNKAGTNGANADEGVNLEETPVYCASLPKEHSHSVFKFLRHGETTKFDATFPSDLSKQSWQQKVSMLCVKLLWRSYGAMKLMGFLIEWNLNFLVLNHGIFGLLFHLITLQWHKIVWPNPNDDRYLSCIGHMDPRSKLLLDTSPEARARSKQADALVFPDESIGSRNTADVCVMAAKLSYENPAVVERVVTQVWNMNFVKFFNCWNEYQKMHNTQAFVFTDKKTDANAIVVAFRGTEGFNAYDWSTDFDFSWVKLDGLGKVHLGFLEALGLVTREDPNTLTRMRNNAKLRAQRRRTQHQGSFRHLNLDQFNEATAATSGLADHLVHSRGRSLAYDDITYEVAVLMKNNPKAKLFITGHSLGGALATLYPVMLFYSEQTEMTDKIAAVYTFGQPRVGDIEFKDYAYKKLKGKYYRIVYCNDMVPRIPFDDAFMQFKHFGDCDYFNSVYDGLTLVEEPNPNYFAFGRMLTMHLNAIWEMFQAMILITLQYGREYAESWFSLMVRLMGIAMPGASAHSLTNYVNAVRLGPFPLRERIEGDAAEFRVMADNVKDIVAAVCVETLRVFGFPVPKQGVKKGPQS